MPFHAGPLTRRQFLTVAAASAGALTLQAAWAEDHDRWALLADTHIAADPEKVVRGVRMAAHLERVRHQLLALEPRPAGALVNGDCALTDGQPGDYARLLALAGPLRQAGIPLHMTLGNHDHRESFWAALRHADPRPLRSKHVSVLETPRANWFLVDSLDRTNVTPGRLGEEQLQWLARELDARPGKPALIFGRHHPVIPSGSSIGGLEDTQALLEVLAPRRQVKAYLFGHTHHWEVREHEGIHLVNLPPVAYVFQQGDPSGWADLQLRPGGAALTLRSLDPAHAAHGKTHELVWRA